ncbi:MAG: hypothetical protein JEZ12_15965 [Desulfobacterium sp.]|nr:hypothetical protein [Desulfobacterium sp.]
MKKVILAVLIVLAMVCVSQAATGVIVECFADQSATIRIGQQYCHVENVGFYPPQTRVEIIVTGEKEYPDDEARAADYTPPPNTEEGMNEMLTYFLYLIRGGE